MGHIRQSFHIDAPIGHVWDMNADVRRMPEWDVNTIEIRDAPERMDLVGAKCTTVVRVLGRTMTGTVETTKVERPHLFEQKIGLPGGGRAEVTVTFVEAGGATEETIEFEYKLPGGMFAGVAERLLSGSIERDSRHSNENFKALCEATVPQPV